MKLTELSDLIKEAYEYETIKNFNKEKIDVVPSFLTIGHHELSIYDIQLDETQELRLSVILGKFSNRCNVVIAYVQLHECDDENIYI